MAKNPLPPTAPPASQLPLPPGIVASVPKEGDTTESRLTDLERQVLEQAGGVEGRIIPDFTDTALGRELAEQIKRARGQATEDPGVPPVSPTTPPLQAAEPVDISQLSPEKQQELYAAVKEAQAMEAHFKAREVPEDIAEVPGLAEAYRTANAGKQYPAPIIENDLFDPTEQPPPATPPPAPPQEPPDEPEEPEQPRDSTPSQTGGKLSENPLCPKCGHLLSQEVPKITDDDKHNFVQAILGGTRFIKEFSIYQGKVIFTFRSLFTTDSDMVFTQLEEDYVDKNPMPSDYMRMMQEYRLALSLESFQREGQAPKNFPAPEDLKNNPKFNSEEHATPLPQLMDYFRRDILLTENMKRNIGTKFMEFQRIVETIESHADDSTFFEKTEESV
jgi:hypothetical protein